MHKIEEYWQFIDQLRSIRTAEADIADMLRDYPANHVIDRDVFGSRVRVYLECGASRCRG